VGSRRETPWSLFSLSSGPMDIGAIIGKQRENQIEIERMAGGFLKMQFPRRESGDKMVTLSGPKSVVDEWASYLCMRYQLKGGPRPKVIKDDSLPWGATYDKKWQDQSWSSWSEEDWAAYKKKKGGN
jgi:hypothetical protein